MIRIIPGFLLRLPLKALYTCFKPCVISKRANLLLLLLEPARKFAKLAQLSCELAVSPVRGKYVNCAKWKCTWNTLDAIGKYLCSSKVFAKYFISKVFGQNISFIDFASKY